MFEIISTKLKDQEIIDAIIKLREGTRIENRKAFADLRDTFEGLIRKQFNAIKQVADDFQERRILQNYAERAFAEILLDKSLDTKKPISHIMAYIRNLMRAKVTNMGARRELGKTPVIRKVRDIEDMIRNSLNKYIKKYHKHPDFKDKKDLDDLAKIMKTKSKDIEEMLKVVSPQFIKSLTADEDRDDNVASLMDALKSQEKLPDEVLEDKELARAFQQAIERYLNPEQRQIFKYYYLESGKQEKTKQELAQELGMSLSKIKDILGRGQDKLKNSPVLKELHYASQINSMVKFAMERYNIIQINGKSHLVNTIKTSSKNLSEQMISEVIQING